MPQQQQQQGVAAVKQQEQAARAGEEEEEWQPPDLFGEGEDATGCDTPALQCLGCSRLVCRNVLGGKQVSVTRGSAGNIVTKPSTESSPK